MVLTAEKQWLKITTKMKNDVISVLINILVLYIQAPYFNNLIFGFNH